MKIKALILTCSLSLPMNSFAAQSSRDVENRIELQNRIHACQQQSQQKSGFRKGLGAGVSFLSLAGFMAMAAAGNAGYGRAHGKDQLANESALSMGSLAAGALIWAAPALVGATLEKTGGKGLIVGASAGGAVAGAVSSVVFALIKENLRFQDDLGRYRPDWSQNYTRLGIMSNIAAISALTLSGLAVYALQNKDLAPEDSDCLSKAVFDYNMKVSSSTDTILPGPSKSNF